MAEHPTFGDFIIGFEGLAIVRSWGLDPATVMERAQSIAEVVERRGEPPWANPMVEREVSMDAGYDEWAAGYDRPDNPVLLGEEPVVRVLLEGLPAGEALDASCGTGRYAQYLASLGHSVTGIDATPAMLEVARGKAPAARFAEGDLTHLPLPAASVDLAVCTLALTHCRELGPPIGELARVVRPGGRVVISDVHPFMTMLGNHARYRATRVSSGSSRTTSTRSRSTWRPSARPASGSYSAASRCGGRRNSGRSASATSDRGSWRRRWRGCPS